MPSIKEILNQDSFGAIVSDLCRDTREGRYPREYMDEYNGDRTRRPDSVGYRQPKKVAVYSETLTDKEGNPQRLDDKTIKVAKVVTNTPKRIVRTAVAFMFGGEMTLSAEDSNDGFNEFKKLYIRKLKMQSVLRKFARKVLSETKAAIIFYPATVYDNNSLIQKAKGLLGIKKSVIKCKILSTPKDNNETCEFYPHFNDDDDMDGFIHKYNVIIEGSNCQCVKIYTADEIITAVDRQGMWSIAKDKNLFKKIPVVYAETEQPEWEDVANLIDKYEMRLSRISDTNDYFAEPILKTYGLSNLPSKETVGKELNFSMEVDPDTGTAYHGDADYLAWQQSIDSMKEELDRTKSEIDAGSSTPDLSFNNMQSLGNLSGVSRKFMTIEATIKASENMEIFGPVVQRTVAIVQAGMANISHTKYASQLNDNYIEVSFGTVLPEDVSEELKNLETASQFNSLETIIKNSPYTDNVEEELARKKKDQQDEAANNTMPGYTFSNNAE